MEDTKFTSKVKPQFQAVVSIGGIVIQWKGSAGSGPEPVYVGGGHELASGIFVAGSPNV